MPTPVRGVTTMMMGGQGWVGIERVEEEEGDKGSMIMAMSTGRVDVRGMGKGTVQEKVQQEHGGKRATRMRNNRLRRARVRLNPGERSRERGLERLVIGREDDR